MTQEQIKAMTPKEKAEGLILKFGIKGPSPKFKLAKQCALICVDEILKYQQVVLSEFPSDGYEPEFWNQVKQEIEKL